MDQLDHDIVQDLLPLYHDGVCSDKSRAAVEEHLQTCEACRACLLYTSCVGAVYPVLFEQPKDGRYFGHAPNYMEVLADGTDLHNQVRNVKVTGTDGASLLGELLED